MERSEFNQAFASKDILMSQTTQEWERLASEYPFSTLLHLLHAQKKKNLSKKDKQKLVVHTDNPLHLSVLLSAKKMGELSKKDKTSKQEEPKKVSRLVSNAAAAKVKNVEGTKTAVPNVEVPVQTELAPKEKNVDLAAESKTKKQQVVNNDKQGATATKEEDVLQLIQDLPEENPIPNTERFASVAEETSPEETETVSEQDPGDLMVMMSFTDWLQYFKTKKESEEEDKKGRDAIRSAWQKEKLAEAMDDDEDVVPDEIFEKAMKSVSFGDGLVTEPLAELYAQQGKTEKAMELYKKLSLLNPEKKVYFASRIKELHLLK